MIKKNRSHLILISVKIGQKSAKISFHLLQMRCYIANNQIISNKSQNFSKSEIGYVQSIKLDLIKYLDIKKMIILTNILNYSIIIVYF